MVCSVKRRATTMAEQDPRDLAPIRDAHGRIASLPGGRQNRTLDRYPDQVKQGCFLLWWERTGKNAKAVARLLAEGDQEALELCGIAPGDRIPNFRTIWRWMNEDQWQIMTMNIQAAGMGDRLRAAAITIMYGTAR